MGRNILIIFKFNSESDMLVISFALSTGILHSVPFNWDAIFLEDRGDSRLVSSWTACKLPNLKFKFLIQV